MSNQLMTFESFNDLLQKQMRQIERAVPKHLKADRLLRIILTEARKTPKLLECSSASLMGSVMLSAQLGLEPGPLGHCYYVPFGKDVTFIIGYKGMLDLAYRSEKVEFIDAQCVFKNDYFEYEYGSDAHLKHKPTMGERGPFIGAYATITLKSGAKHFRFLTKADIDKARATSKGGNSQYSPWATFYEEMACKTAIRKLFKYVPVSIELQQGIAYDEAGEYGKTVFDDELGVLIEGTSIVPEQRDPVERIMDQSK